MNIIFRISAMVIGLYITVFTTGCSDDDTSPSIVNKWKQTAGTYNPAYLGQTDYFSALGACSKSKITEFSSDGTYQTRYGDACGTKKGQITNSGDYSINGSDLIWSSENFKVGFKGRDLMTLVGQFEVNGTTINQTITFERQP